MRSSDYLSQIARNGGSVTSRIFELAGAEIKPAVKGFSLGASLYAGTGFFVYTAMKIFGLALGFFLAWVFWALLDWSVLMSLSIGFVIVAFLALILMVVLAIMAKRQMKQVKAPTATIEEIKSTLEAFGPAVADGASQAEIKLAAIRKANSK